IAESLGMPVSTIYDIPNQPLFDGLREDALVAYTFEKFIKTGNKDWIIFFPMVHSIKKAMDYLSSYFSHYLGVKIEGFILSGASKRGWVTYLVAQDDTRVKGIIPLSFDNVNFRKTIPHQLEQWGKYSPDLFDYEKNGILDMLNTPIGKKLLSYVDPWYIRKKIKIPKLIIVGTNDNYWTIDAASFYFDKLWGPEYIYYMPNRGHSLGWDAKVFSSIKRFILSVVKRYRLPSFKMTYTYSKEEDKVYFRIKSTKVRPSGASIWYATSYTKDFRKAVFREKPLFFSKSQKEFFGWLWLPEMRFMAFYPELKYSKGNSSFYLCAPANILKGQLAHPEMVPKKD
ncbi:MAG TPA: hypothetical protein EYP16_06285, partial [Candidatus Atribacteria bacterium]|nr:hypothetical protein [Candidatus Atribacteria bacterium]